MTIKSLRPQKPIKLDLYGKKIIFYLSQNSRIRRNELARKIGISLPRLLYKIKGLEQEVISPAPSINYPLLSIPSYIIFIQNLHKGTREKLLEIPSFWFFKQAIGKYQYVMNVITENIEKFCKDFLGNCHFEIYPIIRYIPDDYNPWHLKIQPYPLKKDITPNMDRKDYTILAHLSERTTDTLVEISKATSIDRQTVKSRIKKLERLNVIQKFRYGINIFKIGFLVYILKLDITPSSKQKILPHLRNDDYSGFIFETLTGCVMYYMPPSHKELFEFTQRIQDIDNNIHIEAIQTTETFRVDLVPLSVIKILRKRANNLLK